MTDILLLDIGHFLYGHGFAFRILCCQLRFQIGAGAAELVHLSRHDGTVQAMLDLAGVAYTGVRMRAASICMDKLLSKTIVSKRTDVPVPEKSRAHV